MSENNILAKKRWIRLIPIAFITYSFAFLDRANFGFAAAGGMERDLNISVGTVSLLGALFFLGYFLFQIPGAHYAEKKSVKKLIFWSLISWGVLGTATGLVNSIPLLAIIRFLLGVVESAVMPAMLILLSHWFTKSERSKANTFLILGNPVTILWMSVLSGYLIDTMGWREMFIIEGIPAIIFAFLWWRMVDDRPKQANWLSDKEKKDLERQLQKEQETIKPVKNYAAAFKSRVVILLSVQFILWSIGTYGFVMWLPTIISAAPGVSMVETGWLASVPYLFCIIGMIGVSYFSDKTQNRKIFIWVSLLIGAITFYGSYLLGTSHFWLSYVLLVIAGTSLYAPFGTFFAAITDVLPKNVSGVAIALVNSAGALGGFLGAYLVGYLNGIFDGFGISYLFMSCSLLIASFLCILALKNNKKVKNKQTNRVVVNSFN